MELLHRIAATACALAIASCVDISTRTEIRTAIVGHRTDTGVLDQDTTVVQWLDAAAQPILSIRTHQTCFEQEVRTEKRTELVERTWVWNDLAGFLLVSIPTAAIGGMIGIGFGLAAAVAPLDELGHLDRDHAWLAAGGCLGGAALLSLGPIVNGFRAMDSETELPPAEVPGDRREYPCNEQPLVARNVAIVVCECRSEPLTPREGLRLPWSLAWWSRRCVGAYRPRLPSMWTVMRSRQHRSMPAR